MLFVARMSLRLIRHLSVMRLWYHVWVVVVVRMHKAESPGQNAAEFSDRLTNLARLRSSFSGFQVGHR